MRGCSFSVGVGVGVLGLGLALGFRVEGLEFRVWGLWFVV